MNFLIDIGNTRIKWGLSQKYKIIAGEPVLNHEKNLEKKLRMLWRNVDQPRRIAISCVSHEEIFSHINSVAQQLWPAVEIISVKAQKSAFGVLNAYHRAEKLGSDRWLALVALRHFHALPVCVVDCGTAITIDMLNAQGDHLGGLISPGLTMMKKSLSKGTQDLKFSDHDFSTGLSLADTTECAIYNGTLFAAVGLIECILKNSGNSMHLVLTGGDAALIDRYVSFNAVIEADLVLQGLSLVMDENK